MFIGGMALKYFVIALLFSTNTKAKEFAAPFPALPKVAPAPADNPTTSEKVELGKKLYLDPILSYDGSSSCNSCHNIMGAGDDGHAFSVGINGQKGGRSSPTVFNAAFLSVQFWDGRAATLEEQALGPLTNPVEMGNPNHEVIIERLKKVSGYAAEFKKVFGGSDSVNKVNLAKAIAAFERTLITADTPYDRFERGDKSALSAEAKKGMQLVQNVGCTSCHSGSNFSGPTLPMGVGFYQKFPVYPGSKYDSQYQLTTDLGRNQVTKKDEDKNMWRVPTWRNVALTAPYFHNGSVKTLEEAVKVMAKTQLNKELSEDQTKNIVEFLKSLNGSTPKIAMPKLPRREAVLF